MYKVFVNESPLYLTSEKGHSSGPNAFLLKRKDIKKAIESLVNGKFKEAYLYHPDADRLLEKFTATIPQVVAGGGLVKNAKGKTLFIYRNGKWDLPKGKMDGNETIYQCAIREVMEETGVKDLQMEQFLMTTYHLFKRSGAYKLKVTHWYQMKTNYDGPLKGQKNEGIDKVKWKGPKKIAKALKNSYANIRLLFGDD